MKRHGYQQPIMLADDWDALDETAREAVLDGMKVVASNQAAADGVVVMSPWTATVEQSRSWVPLPDGDADSPANSVATVTATLTCEVLA